jgi:hypothetical protein
MCYSSYKVIVVQAPRASSSAVRSGVTRASLLQISSPSFIFSQKRTAHKPVCLGVALELRAELAREVVVLVAVVPVLLPLVHVLRVLLLLAPLCVNERRGRKNLGLGSDDEGPKFLLPGAREQTVAGGLQECTHPQHTRTFVAELLELVVALEVDGDVFLGGLLLSHLA